MAVEQRPLGSQGLVASCQGLGAMGMTAFYSADPAADEAESLRTLARALELGINFVDTAWIYQHESGATNEELARVLARCER
jgi:aryl-alcohol dehydrogenase-like predicted oxidoreductase